LGSLEREPCRSPRSSLRRDTGWAMSANLELVRSIYADWERGDLSRSDWADPEIEYVEVGGVEPGTWKGLTAIAERWLNFLGAWNDVRVTAEEYRELDDERVLVLVHLSGRGRTSGLDLEQMSAKTAHLIQSRHGKVTGMVFYYDRDHAFADLGLTADGESP